MAYISFTQPISWMIEFLTFPHCSPLMFGHYFSSSCFNISEDKCPPMPPHCTVSLAEEAFTYFLHTEREECARDIFG